MIRRPRATAVPMKIPVRFLYGQIVDRRMAFLHQTSSIEVPVFVTIGTEPLTAVVVPFVRKADSNPVVRKCPKLFDEPIIQFARPFAREELDDRRPSDQELAAVAPPTFRVVGEADAVWVTCIPAILRGADLLECALAGKRGERGTCFRHHSNSGPISKRDIGETFSSEPHRWETAGEPTTGPVGSPPPARHRPGRKAWRGRIQRRKPQLSTMLSLVRSLGQWPD